MTRGEESGCVELSEVNEFVEPFDLDDSDVQGLFDEIESRGYELTDGCGRDVPEQVSYANEDLAAATTDALQLFLTDLRRYPLLTASQEVDLARRIERGDTDAKHTVINSNLRLARVVFVTL